MFKMFSGLKATATALTLGAAFLASGTAEAAKVRVAFGDIASVELLHLLAAFERAREQGVDIEVTYLKSEDIAAQAVVGGQADIGVGGPYALVQKVKAPIRMFLQLSTLRFYPGRERASSTRPGRISTGRRSRSIRAAPAPRPS